MPCVLVVDAVITEVWCPKEWDSMIYSKTVSDLVFIFLKGQSIPGIHFQKKSYHYLSFVMQLTFNH